MTPLSPPFDLTTYLSRYPSQSETHLQRVVFLAHQFHSSADPHHQQLARQAFEHAVNQMKLTGNHRRYLEEFGAECPSEESHPELVATHRESRIQHYLTYDAEFVAESKSSGSVRLETLEARLTTAQSHINKESIRTALLALAEFHRGRGELREAWRRAARSREYCVNGLQHWNVCLLLVTLTIDLRDWTNVRDAIARAEHTVLGESEDPLFIQKLRAANGILHLAQGKYSEAAKLFTSVSLDLTNQFNSVLSAEDLAMYGALLGLATLDRATFHSLVIDGPFKARLELVPAMRDALRHYSLAEYGQCISTLQNSIKSDILLDIHLHAHASTILDMIRDRCIVQYFQPYSSVSLERMGNVFGYKTNEMEEIVAKLISNGGVTGMPLGDGARINAREKTLSVYGNSCVQQKARRRARVSAAKMGIQFVRNAEGMIMRVACLENGVVIQGGSGRRMTANRRDTPTRPSNRDRMVLDVPENYESDDSCSDDDIMEVDYRGGVNLNAANPNDF